MFLASLAIRMENLYSTYLPKFRSGFFWDHLVETFIAITAFFSRPNRPALRNDSVRYRDVIARDVQMANVWPFCAKSSLWLQIVHGAALSKGTSFYRSWQLALHRFFWTGNHRFTAKGIRVASPPLKFDWLMGSSGRCQHNYRFIAASGIWLACEMKRYYLGYFEVIDSTITWRWIAS